MEPRFHDKSENADLNLLARPDMFLCNSSGPETSLIKNTVSVTYCLRSDVSNSIRLIARGKDPEKKEIG